MVDGFIYWCNSNIGFITFLSIFVTASLTFLLLILTGLYVYGTLKLSEISNSALERSNQTDILNMRPILVFNIEYTENVDIIRWVVINVGKGPALKVNVDARDKGDFKENLSERFFQQVDPEKDDDGNPIIVQKEASVEFTNAFDKVTEYAIATGFDNRVRLFPKIHKCNEIAVVHRTDWTGFITYEDLDRNKYKTDYQNGKMTYHKLGKV